MSDKRCLICKYLGDHSEKILHKDFVFRSGSNGIAVFLCQLHSWELHRSGQFKFFDRYVSIFAGHYGTENESEVIDYVRTIVRKTKHPWSA